MDLLDGRLSLLHPVLVQQLENAPLGHPAGSHLGLDIDPEGVGALLKMGVVKGRRTRPELEVGICGEHGGDPASVAFCHGAGLNYVSCSPFRVPIARLAAGHAALQATRDED